MKNVGYGEVGESGYGLVSWGLILVTFSVAVVVLFFVVYRRRRM